MLLNRRFAVNSGRSILLKPFRYLKGNCSDLTVTSNFSIGTVSVLLSHLKRVREIELFNLNLSSSHRIHSVAKFRLAISKITGKLSLAFSD